jgi:hypothetical protein
MMVFAVSEDYDAIFFLGRMGERQAYTFTAISLFIINSVIATLKEK